MKGSYLRAKSFCEKRFELQVQLLFCLDTFLFSGLVNEPSIFFGMNKKLPPPTNLGRKLHKTEERYFWQKLDLKMTSGI
jgi:hypothetical protein